MSLFAQQPRSTPTLFTPSNPQPSGSLFGSSQPTQSGGLFGSTQTTQPTQPGGLFGSAQSTQPAQTNSLFGNANAQPKTNTTSLFSNSTTQQPASTSLFGSTSTAQPQPASTSLFGQPTQQQQPQNNALTGSLSNGLGASTGIGALNSQSQREITQSRLQAAGLNSSVREKSVPQQVQTLLEKWHPESPDTLLQTYLYNAANPNFAPFYHPSPGESEKDYEAALAKKPEPVDGNTWVPVLVRGFKALGERVEFQAKFVQSMQVRLHEMNNSLTAIMNKHSQDLSVRIDTARKQHVALSQRTMRLAVKCQVLRNRGYALDAQEETLRTSLLELQKQVQDPAFSSREEAVWARMVVLRERARWLEEETKRLDTTQQSTVGDAPGLPEHLVQNTKRVLGDFAIQLKQLTRALAELEKEFDDIQAGIRGDKS